MQIKAVAALAVFAAVILTGATQGFAQDETAPVLPTHEDAEPGQTYLKETYRDWQLRCVKQEEGVREPCQMYQLLRNANDVPVAEFTVIALPESSGVRAGATIITPLETLLTENLVLAISPEVVKQYPYNFCTTAGCFSQLGFSAEDIAALKAGVEAQVRIVPVAAPDSPVTLTASLLGFTAAFDLLAARIDEETAAQ